MVWPFEEMIRPAHEKRTRREPDMRQRCGRAAAGMRRTNDSVIGVADVRRMQAVCDFALGRDSSIA